MVLRVRASSLNYHDVFTRRGMPGIKIAMPMIMGLDIAGEIWSSGRTSRMKIGDRVLVDPANRVEGGLIGETIHGGLAELCRVRAHQLIRLPDHVGFNEAAAIPVVYGTAIRMMHTIGRVEKDEKILIIGASGGVGVCCVQLAKLAGATVIGCVSSEEKAAKLRALGADRDIDYVKDDFVKEIFALYGKPNRPGAGRHKRRRCGGELHGRRHLGEIAALPARRRTHPDLWRDRGIQSDGRPPLHLDVRAAGSRLERIPARGHRQRS